MVAATLPSSPDAAPPPRLAGLLAEFAGTEAARACAEPPGAYANCLALSALCARWLRERGVECGLLHLSGSRAPFDAGAGRWPYYEPAQIEHWTVRAGDWSVDWTARQFHATAAWPSVERVDELATRWGRSDDWACPRCPELVSDARHAELAPAGMDGEHREVALARLDGSSEPFLDPRHDDGAPLVRLCACPPPAPAAQA